MYKSLKIFFNSFKFLYPSDPVLKFGNVLPSSRPKENMAQNFYYANLLLIYPWKVKVEDQTKWHHQNLDLINMDLDANIVILSALVQNG